MTKPLEILMKKLPSDVIFNVKVKVAKEMKIRMAISMFLMKLSVRVLGARVEWITDD